MVVGANLIDKIVTYIVDPLLLLIFALGLFMFMWGLVTYMRNVDNDSGRTKGRNHMIWGIIGMFIMVAVQGIIGLVVDTFEIGVNQTPFGSGVQNAVNANNPFFDNR